MLTALPPGCVRPRHPAHRAADALLMPWSSLHPTHAWNPATRVAGSNLMSRANRNEVIKTAIRTVARRLPDLLPGRRAA